MKVATFWRSFRTFRDLAVAGLMLLDGLRSCEVLAVQLEDLQLASTQMRVLGKGNKQRLLPLPQPIIDVLQNYLRLERPPHSLAFSVRLPQRPPSWTTHDRGRTPLPVPPSSRHQPGSSGQSSSIPAYLRRRYGARRHLLARAPTSHGTFSDPHHHALCPTRSQGCLGRIRPGHRKPDPFGIFSHPMSQSRPSLEEIFETHIQTLALTRRPATVSRLSRRRSPLPVLSPHRFSRPEPAQPTSPRSSSARLARFAVATTTALIQQNPRQ